MYRIALVVGSVLVVTSCVAVAGAGEAEPGVSEVASTTTAVPVERQVSIVIAGPVEYRDVDGSYHVRVDWSHHISHGNLNLTVDAVVELEIVPTGLLVPESAGLADADSEGADVGFDVFGEVRYQADTMACESTSADQDCGVVGLIDASLHGSAKLSGSTLVISVGWVSFGRDQVPGRSAIMIGRWPASGRYSTTSGAVELHEIAGALEAAGVIGRPFSVDTRRPRTQQLTGVSTYGRGEGLLELLPANRTS